MNRLRHIILSITLMFGSLIPATISAGTVYAQTGKAEICKGVNTQSGSASTCDGDGAGTALSNVIKVAIRIFQAVIGIVSLFVIFMAGLGYITSGGDSGKTATAKNRLLYAAIGLVIVGLAQVIISFVLTRVDSANTPVVTPPTTP